jgi:hypothetical protein
MVWWSGSFIPLGGEEAFSLTGSLFVDVMVTSNSQYKSQNHKIKTCPSSQRQEWSDQMVCPVNS